MRRNTRTDAKIAYQMLKRSDRSGCQKEVDPWENFPEQFNELAPQYGIPTDNNDPKYDQASYDFMKERVMIVLTGMIKKRSAKKLQPPKTVETKKKKEIVPPVTPPTIAPAKGRKKWKDEKTQALF